MPGDARWFNRAMARASSMNRARSSSSPAKARRQGVFDETTFRFRASSACSEQDAAHAASAPISSRILCPRQAVGQRWCGFQGAIDFEQGGQLRS